MGLCHLSMRFLRLNRIGMYSSRESLWNSSSLDEMVVSVAGLEGFDVDSLGEEVFVLVQWVVASDVVVVWWTDGLLEASIFLSLLHVALDRVVEVLLRELTVVRYPVVEWCGLIVPQVLEATHVGVAKVEWQVGISVVYSAQLSSFKVGLNVVLNNWVLNVGSVLSPSRLSINAITKCEDVIKSLVLKGVWANID